MNVKVQRRIASEVMKCGLDRVRFDTTKSDEIKESITKTDIRRLISDGVIGKKQKKGVSRARANKISRQKSKHRRQGPGRRKGRATARTPQKEKWMSKIRIQRKLLKTLRDSGKLAKPDYHSLYGKAKGGFFRSKRHLQFYMKEHNLVKNK